MVGPPTQPATKKSADYVEVPSRDEFKLRHWRSSSSLRRRTADAIPPALDLPATLPPARIGDHRYSPRDSSGYTSLRDLLCSPPSAASLGSPGASPAATQIRIRNRLVKQAAYAYLQPTPSATESSPRRDGVAAALWRACVSCFGFLGHILRGLRR